MVNKLRCGLDQLFLFHEAKFPLEWVTQVTYVGSGNQIGYSEFYVSCQTKLSALLLSTHVVYAL